MLLLLLGVAFLSSVVVYFFSECRLLLLMITETTVFLPFPLCHTSNLYISSLYNKKLPGMPKLETEYAQNRVLVQDIKGLCKIYTHHSKSKEVKFPINCMYAFDNQSADAAVQETLTVKKCEEHLRKYCGLDLVTARSVVFR